MFEKFDWKKLGKNFGILAILILIFSPYGNFFSPLFFIILFAIGIYKIGKKIATRHFDRETGVEIVTTVNRDIFPEDWLSYPDKNPSATAIPNHLIENRIKQIKNALNKYPKHIIKKNLKTIYALSSLRLYGIPYGGTYIASDGVIYITGPEGGQEDFIEECLHHEFSSILFYHYHHLFDATEWEGNCRLEYGKGGFEAIKEGKHDYKFDPRLHEKGFLHQYATSCLEDDFNSFSENLFCGREEFWKLVNKYPLLRGKMKVFIDFYSKIDSIFTESYFKGFCKSDSP